MSNYTTELRYICEYESGRGESCGFNDVNSIIKEAIPKIFSFDFPIFDESYRNVICAKILKHYYTREIGEETYGLWKLRLDTRLNEIMPYYNEMYSTLLLKFNPLYDTDITTTHYGKTDGNNKSSNTNTSNSEEKRKGLYSDTPQGGIEGIESEAYLTNARIDESNSKLDNSGETNTQYTDSNEYITHVMGKTGGKTYSGLIKEFRDNIINIDMMIINNLSDLFINLW